MRNPEIQVLHELLTSAIVKAEDIDERGVVVHVLRAKNALIESERAGAGWSAKRAEQGAA